MTGSHLVLVVSWLLLGLSHWIFDIPGVPEDTALNMQG